MKRILNNKIFRKFLINRRLYNKTTNSRNAFYHCFVFTARLINDVITNTSEQEVKRVGCVIL